MKRFLAVYLGSPDSPAHETWNALSDADRDQQVRAGMQAWMRWGEENAAAIVERGGPLGKTKRTDARGVSDTKNMICGYVLIEAPSHEAAARMFEKHPHFAIFPGDCVEIMECTPIPTQ
jgi:hypothetical protein